MVRCLGYLVVIIALSIGPASLIHAKGPPPGETVAGLQAQLQLEEDQVQPFDARDAIRMRLTLKNVGPQPLILYQGNWSERILVAGVVDREQSGRYVRLRGLLHCIDRTVEVSVDQSPETLAELNPGDSLSKLLECTARQPGQYDVVVLVTLIEDHYKDQVSPEVMSRAWTGTVTSTLVIVEVAAPNLAQIEQALRELRDANASVRISAAKSLGQFGAKEHVKDLASLFNDPDGNVRMAAQDAVASFAVDVIEDVLRYMVHRDVLVRQSASSAFTKITFGLSPKEAEDVARLLIERLEERDEWIRAVWVDALGRLDQRLTGDTLAEVTKLLMELSADQNPKIRAKSIAALGRIAFVAPIEEETTASIVQIANSRLTDGHWEVRLRATGAFWQMGSRAQLYLTENVRRRLMERLEDEHSWVRREAAAALGEHVFPLLTDKETQFLVEKLNAPANKDREAVDTVILHLGELAKRVSPAVSRTIIDTLLNRLGDLQADMQVRRSAGSALLGVTDRVSQEQRAALVKFLLLHLGDRDAPRRTGPLLGALASGMDQQLAQMTTDSLLANYENLDVSTRHDAILIFGEVADHLRPDQLKRAAEKAEEFLQRDAHRVFYVVPESLRELVKHLKSKAGTL